MTDPVSLAARMEQRWITNDRKDAAIRASRVPSGIRITTTHNVVELTMEQAQILISQIRNESRKVT